LVGGSPARARELLDQAIEQAQASGLRGEMSGTALVEAEWLAAGDRLAEAIAAGLASADDAQAAKLPVREGQARVLLGELYHRNGDPAAGREQLGMAKNLFQASGADWLAAEATNAQRRLGAGQPRRRARGQGAPALSGREREIVKMVAEGMTNRAIADRLFLSPRTVEAHMARIFAKLGVSTRSAVVGLFGTEDI
jgi:DNA-binding CsgD family transcriptional regulator